MKKERRILYITMGLPGSGKTHWSNEKTDNNRYGSKGRRIDIDELTTGKIDEKRIHSLINDYISQTGTSYIVIDGLFLTFHDVYTLLKMVDSKNFKFLDEISIEYWLPDVQSCLHNDKGRRDLSCEVTIRNAQMDSINDNFIKKLEGNFPELVGKIKKNSHTIMLKPKWKEFAEEHSLYIDEKGIVKSSSWCMGGTWGSCWDDKLGTVSPEPEPDSFPEFDKLLEKISPGITYLQYKSIYREVVSTETSYDSDYYGGSTTHAYKYFKVENLYNALRERNLI